MKKIIIITAAVLGFAVAATAQPRAIGARFGNGAEISYQHSMGADFLEVDGGLGLGLGDGSLSVAATGIYNIMIAQPNWTSKGEWGFYAGPGAGVSLGLGNGGHLGVAVAGMVGLEYTFWFPLQLSLDFRQQIGYGFSGAGLISPSSVALSVRYRF